MNDAANAYEQAVDDAHRFEYWDVLGLAVTLYLTYCVVAWA